MNRTDIRRIRGHIKRLGEREDFLRSQLKLTALGGRSFIESEADALEWALSVLVPLVKLQEAKIERERMSLDQNNELTKGVK